MIGLLRRLFGGGRGETAPAARPVDPTEVETAERAHEREVLREEQARLDELQQRQLRYAEYAWTPPAQGGERRADEADDTGEAGSAEA